MTRIIILSFFFGVCLASVIAQSAHDGQTDDDFAGREERYLKTIDKYSTDTSPEAIEKLGAIVRRMAHEDKRGPHNSQAFTLARKRLLEIPGVAEHFKQRILAISAWENGESSVPTYDRRGWLFQTLTQLPHPETIRVLGELLQDARDPTKGVVSDSRYVPNSVNASYALRKIGLRKPPEARLDGDAWEEVLSWRLWFEQVQHGKPFSFEGDPKTYTLADKSRATVTRQERRPRTGEGDTASDTAGRMHKPVLMVILGLLLLAVTIAASKLLRKWRMP
jgi:hypothetical protein